MNSEEYRAFKQQEKAEVFDALSEATLGLLSADKLREYADLQAKLFGHSASNVLLIIQQKPEATWVRTFDDWKSDNVSLKKGEKGILTLDADYYGAFSSAACYFKRGDSCSIRQWRTIHEYIRSNPYPA